MHSVKLLPAHIAALRRVAEGEKMFAGAAGPGLAKARFILARDLFNAGLVVVGPGSRVAITPLGKEAITNPRREYPRLTTGAVRLPPRMLWTSSREAVARAIELVKQGKSTVEAAHEAGCDPKSVRDARRRLGVDADRVGFKIHWPETKQAVELVRGGMPMAEAARQTGMSRQIVRRACEQAGVDTWPVKPRSPSDVEALAIAACKSGLSYREFGKRCGLSKSAVSGIVRDYRLRSGGKSNVRS